MLTHIHIENFIIVDTLSLDFHQGLNVLTGETGAGKSIWVDAVGLALGNRADNNLIRQGVDHCDISVCFDLTDIPQAQQWLQQQELATEEECIIRRIIARKGSSKCSINGKPCPLQLVRELGELIINIHSQHQHQALLQRDTQRNRLDHYADNEKLLSQTQQCYQRAQQLTKELDQLKAQSGQRDEELQLCQYQLNELEELNLQANEWQQLSDQHQKLHHAQDTIQALIQTDELLNNDENSATAMVQKALQTLQSIKIQDPALDNIQELINSGLINLQEAAAEVQHYQQQCDLDPESLANIENRLSKIHDLARKHHAKPEDLNEVQNKLATKIDRLQNIDSKINSIESELQQLSKQYQQIASELSKKREAASKKINKAITEHMQTLGIKGGVFKIDLEPQAPGIHATGNEKINFLVCTNPGQSLQPLNKVVSGGELSRISLALQVITAAKSNTPTLIFDEVDVGIGGPTAAVVGKLLKQLGEHTQVLCITHLPQVAACGDHHYQIQKIAKKNSTETIVSELNDEQRSEEIARMLGGTKITEQTRAHAKELLAAI
jgi:DNA repair protein RecN (Recombination protein N)